MLTMFLIGGEFRGSSVACTKLHEDNHEEEQISNLGTPDVSFCTQLYFHLQ